MNINPILYKQHILDSGAILASAILKAKKAIKVGITPLELDSIVEKEILDLGGIPVFKGYGGFPNSSCISVNTQVVHTVPSNKKLKAGDIVTIDAGVKYKEHCTDCARTYIVGEPTNLFIHMMLCVNKALNSGIQAAIPNCFVGDISYEIQKVIFLYKGFDFQIPEELGGHGIGFVPHQDPFIPNYGKKGTGPKLPEGICLAIEPIIFNGSNKIILEEDGWTYSSETNVLSVHVEDTIIVTSTGPINATRKTLTGEIL